MTHLHENQDFWQVPLSGTVTYFAPLGPNDDLSRAEALFVDERVFELAAGLGWQPAAEQLRAALFAERVMQLWLVRPGDSTEPVALAVYSKQTGLHRVGLFFWDSPRQPPMPMWQDALEVLTTHVLQCLPECRRVFHHVALPVSTAADAMLMEAGWEQWNAAELGRDPVRAVYGLERAVYDLYHAEVSEDEAL